MVSHQLMQLLVLTGSFSIMFFVFRDRESLPQSPITSRQKMNAVEKWQIQQSIMILHQVGDRVDWDRLRDNYMEYTKVHNMKGRTRTRPRHLSQITKNTVDIQADLKQLVDGFLYSNEPTPTTSSTTTLGSESPTPQVRNSAMNPEPFNSTEPTSAPIGSNSSNNPTIDTNDDAINTELQNSTEPTAVPITFDTSDLPTGQAVDDDVQIELFNSTVPSIVPSTSIMSDFPSILTDDMMNAEPLTSKQPSIVPTGSEFPTLLVDDDGMRNETFNSSEPTTAPSNLLISDLPTSLVDDDVMNPNLSISTEPTEAPSVFNSSSTDDDVMTDGAINATEPSVTPFALTTDDTLGVDDDAFNTTEPTVSPMSMNLSEIPTMQTNDDVMNDDVVNVTEPTVTPSLFNASVTDDMMTDDAFNATEPTTSPSSGTSSETPTALANDDIMNDDIVNATEPTATPSVFNDSMTDDMVTDDAFNATEPTTSPSSVTSSESPTTVANDDVMNDDIVNATEPTSTPSLFNASMTDDMMTDDAFNATEPTTSPSSVTSSESPTTLANDDIMNDDTVNATEPTATPSVINASMTDDDAMTDDAFNASEPTIAPSIANSDDDLVALVPTTPPSTIINSTLPTEDDDIALLMEPTSTPSEVRTNTFSMEPTLEFPAQRPTGDSTIEPTINTAPLEPSIAGEMKTNDPTKNTRSPAVSTPDVVLIPVYRYSRGNCPDPGSTGLPCAPRNLPGLCSKGPRGSFSSCLRACLPSFCCIHDAPKETNSLAPTCVEDENCPLYAPCYIVWWKIHDTIGPAPFLNLVQNDDFYDTENLLDVTRDREFFSQWVFHHWNDIDVLLEKINPGDTLEQLFSNPDNWNPDQRR